MGLDFAIDELYGTGWSDLDITGCEHTPAGRAYPGLRRIEREFEEAGKRLRLRFMPAFDCYRAEWTTAIGAAEGAVVGQTQEEAAVYALARLRRPAAVTV